MTIYEKLLELYPNCIDGHLGGRACAVVGQLGLEVYSYGLGTKYNHRYKENEKIDIIFFNQDGMLIRTELGNAMIEYNKFKGISWEVKVRELKN